MCTSFMIGNELLYVRSDMLLRNLENGDEIAISGVKDRCFKCLMAHSEQGVVSRKLFFDEVWEQFGLYVSDSSLLQTIYALRRDLKSIGIHDLIVTHPRLGYRINPACTIRPVDSPPETELPISKPESVSPESDILQIELINKHTEEQHSTSTTQRSVSANLVVHGRKVLITLALIAVVAVFFMLSNFIRKTEFYHYERQGIEGDIYIIEHAKGNLFSCECKTSKYVNGNKIPGCICDELNTPG